MNLNVSSLKQGLLAVFDCVQDCVLTVESEIIGQQNNSSMRQDIGTDTTDNVPLPVRQQNRKKVKQPPRYSIRLEYSSSSSGNKVNRSDSLNDEGGFDLKLPPNRFRTRSIAIVAGYSPERLYSNMPPGAFVVESGVYKVGADRDWVKSEPIYWKQVVYGSRNGSEGSGTYPRKTEQGQKKQQVFHETKLVPDANLELHGDAKLRASSPIEQGQPMVDWMSPQNNYSDISSVPHPSSAERSFPSTLLTNPLSSLSSNNFSLEQTQSSGSRSRGRVPSLRTIPEDSRLSVQADIHAVSEYSNLAEYSTGPQTPSARTIRYQSTTNDLVSDNAYLQRDWPITLSPEISFPGHQFGRFPAYMYPAPVHRAISPSKQYPARPQEVTYTQSIPAAPTDQAPHIQPPKIADIRVGEIDPKEMDIYQRIAQLDPERSNMGLNQRPLATSSPPGKRKESGEEKSEKKPRFPTPPEMSVQHLSSTSPSRSRVSFESPVIKFDTMNLSQGRLASPQVATPKKLPLQSALKSKSSRSPKNTSDELSFSSTKELSQKMTETVAASVDTLHQRPHFSYNPKQDVDSVSVVSEGLDAEVTAITSSSSPGSSGSNTLQPLKPEHSLGKSLAQTPQQKTDIDRSSSSGIASKNTSQNQTSSSHSTSGSLSQHHTSSMSPENLSDLKNELRKQTSITSPTINPKRSPSSRLEDTMQVLYENWPPRPQQFPSPSERVAAKQVHYMTNMPSPHIASGVPPFVIHQMTGTRVPVSRGAISSPDTSLETPPSRGSRPNSSQSAPLDRSVDRHYEWDKVTAVDDTSLPSLPPEWSRSRRSPAYNPRRDRDIGHMAQSNRDRVFSDSEIYSNVFPRRRLQMDVEARVRAMKKEFNEYRKNKNSSPNENDRLESLI